MTHKTNQINNNNNNQHSRTCTKKRKIIYSSEKNEFCLVRLCLQFLLAPPPPKMLSVPFLSNYVLLLLEPPHFTRLLLKCTKNDRRIYHLSVVYGGHGGDHGGLVFASGKGYLKTVKYLVSRGANMHADNDKALRRASKYDQLEVVKYLVSRGADVRSWDDGALICASKYGHLGSPVFGIFGGKRAHKQRDE
jgi:hypothetical protein